MGELDGEELVVGIGRYGAYIRHGKSFTSLQKGDDPYTVTYERCVELVKAKEATAAAARTPLRTFDEDQELLIKQGPYGAYIAYKGKNYRLPKGAKIEELSYEGCLEIINKSKRR